MTHRQLRGSGLPEYSAGGIGFTAAWKLHRRKGAGKEKWEYLGIKGKGNVL